MQLTKLTVVVAFVAVACQHDTADARAGHALASALNDSIGAKGGPSVAILMKRGQRNLQIQFDTAAFANLSGPSFQVRARTTAEFSLRHYSADPGDSVIVIARTLEQPGAWRIVRRASFARADLAKTP